MGARAREDLEAVAALFNAMSWYGEIHDGYSVLKPWSLKFDRSGGPKIFLAESSVWLADEIRYTMWRIASRDRGFGLIASRKTAELLNWQMLPDITHKN